jgi:hypothetical protein
MKIYVWLTGFLFLLIPGLCLSQGYNGGLIGGFSISQVDGDQNGGFNKLGLSGGAFVSRDHSEGKHRYGFEILYMQKGSRNKTDKNNPGQPVWHYHYQYAEVPVFYQYTGLPVIKPYGAVSVARLIDVWYDDGGSKKEVDDIKRTDFLLNLGAEVKFSDYLGLLIRYQYSITSIRNRTKAPNTTFIRNGVYHNLINVSLKYYFGENKR